MDFTLNGVSSIGWWGVPPAYPPYAPYVAPQVNVQWQPTWTWPDSRVEELTKRVAKLERQNIYLRSRLRGRKTVRRTHGELQ